jgi:Mn-dependent DtxR family transcriptional regulator
VNVTRQNDILPALPATERDIATKLNVTLSTARAYLYRLKTRGLAVKTMRNPAWWERARC